jgi:flagellar protein FlaG
VANDPVRDVVSTAPVPASQKLHAVNAVPALAKQVTSDDKTAGGAVVQAAVQQIQKYLQDSGRSIDFHFDDSSGLPIVTVRDATTGEVIRQLPSEETLRLAQLLKEGNGLQSHATLRLIV